MASTPAHELTLNPALTRAKPRHYIRGSVNPGAGAESLASCCRAGVYALSKLSKLKQEAYLASKKRDWEEAVSIYERILEIDKNNPTLINELGDICLRKGDGERAIELFLSAAANYRNTGLQNNAVAIYKKILRHDEDNLNAHWFLAEIRSGQGLHGEGEQHALRFLAASEGLVSDLKELYLKRCTQLLNLYPVSKVVLERMRDVFRFWSMPLEGARVACLQACLVRTAGEQDTAEEQIAELLAKIPDLKNYAEYRLWQRRLDPQGGEAEYTDVNALDLRTPTNSDEGQDVAEMAMPDPPGGVEGASSGETSFADLMNGIEHGAAVLDSEPAAQVEPDEEGCFDIDAEETASSFAELLDEMTDEQPAALPREQNVDLLAEILSEEEPDLGDAEERQADVIASEIGEQVGGDSSPEDAARQYEMGMVYLEMGMFEQASACFATASQDQDHALRCFEMWGITLLRMQRADQAVEVLGRGLDITGVEPKEQLGLIYHSGRAHELAGRRDEAREQYAKAHDISPSFLDVEERLSSLPQAVRQA